MRRPWSKAPCLHSERARDREGGSRTAWCAGYWRGECPAQGGGGGSQRSQISLPSRPESTKTVPKQPVSRTFGPKNRLKRCFFYLKVLNNIYSGDFFEEYINFKNVGYLRHCGVIPVQSFGSHKRPQPP
jgi:hypothetical protein